jgi:hypothetical protein
VLLSIGWSMPRLFQFSWSCVGCCEGILYPWVLEAMILPSAAWSTCICEPGHGGFLAASLGLARTRQTMEMVHHRKHNPAGGEATGKCASLGRRGLRL